MPNYLKPQSPLYYKTEDTYFYPLTTADQVITSTGERLNSLFKKTIRESATLRVADWSETLPYTQTIILSESTDDYSVDINIAYNDADNTTLNKAAGCLSYIKKNHKDITFYCLKNKPTIDIPIDITATCRNTIATVEEGTKLNFDIKRYNTEEELLADTPKENTIGIISDVEINGYRFSAIEPEDMVDGMVWIKTDNSSYIAFDIVDGVTVYPISAKQYVSGAWVEKTAKIRQNGVWVDWWDGTLYEAGNLYEDYTGGWSSEGYTHPNGIVSGTIDTNGIHLTGNANKLVMVGTKEPVNLTGYTKLKVKGIVSSSLYNISIEVFLCPTQYVPDMVAEFHLNSTTGQREEEFDIENFDGEYYIICAAGMSSKCVGTFSYLQLL